MLILDSDSTCKWHCNKNLNSHSGCKNEQQADNNNQHTRIRIKDYEIDEVEETKFLGVTIDNKLTWLSHLKLLAKKLRCCSGQLNRI